MINSILLIWFGLGVSFLTVTTINGFFSQKLSRQFPVIAYILLPMLFMAPLQSSSIATGCIIGSYILHRYFYTKPIINLLSVLLLWLPFEFEFYTTPTTTLPIAFGMIILAFYSIFFIFSKQRSLTALKSSYLINWSDIKISVFGYACLATIIIPIGFLIDFLHFNLFDPSLQFFVNTLFVGYFFVALPEELLFRYLMTDLLTPFFKNKWALLIGMAIIFGFAHANNEMDILGRLNWEYVGLATIAGLGYGGVYYRTNKIAAVAITHMLINLTWALFFYSPY